MMKKSCEKMKIQMYCKSTKIPPPLPLPLNLLGVYGKQSLFEFLRCQLNFFTIIRVSFNQ